ncbi:hypothetical protein V1506DRAFT_238009 [Lipomyces tetrasporus]
MYFVTRRHRLIPLIELLLAAITISTLVYLIYRHSCESFLMAKHHYDVYDEELSHRELLVDNIVAFGTADSAHLPSHAATLHREYQIPQTKVNYLSEFRNLDKCPVSSEDVAAIGEAAPCYHKNTLLESLSSGGRIGLDSPYHSKSCGMWWYGTHELCNVLAKYSKVMFVGDDVLEDIFGGMMLLIREDAMYGAVRQWHYNSIEDMKCSCETAFRNHGLCESALVRSLKELTDYDTTLLKCPRAGVQMQMHYLPRYPLDPVEVNRFVMAATKDSDFDRRPIAVIYGHGHGSLFDKGATASWISTLRDMIHNAIPYDVPIYELFVTPGATGPQVSGFNTLTLGLKASQVFESAMRDWGRDVQMDVLGTWNATVQTSFSADGLHGGVQTNLLKAMMVLNWLDLVNNGSG